jgi:hypothetical protein
MLHHVVFRVCTNVSFLLIGWLQYLRLLRCFFFTRRTTQQTKIAQGGYQHKKIGALLEDDVVKRRYMSQ